jgi:serine/threonine-protein phosphatase 2B catalytic subunit
MKNINLKMEVLPDPCNDRQVKEVKPPPQKRLTKDNVVFNRKIDLLILKDHLLAEGQLDKELI